MTQSQKKFVIIDGNALIHRCFHALPPFKTSKGEQVNAVYGFVSVLFSILEREKPAYLAVAFDKKGPTFRHELSSDYKATRMKAPDELYAQIPRIHQIVSTFGIQIFEKDGFEADDLIGTLAARVESGSGVHTLIVTGDMDTIQLIDPNTTLAATRSGFSKVEYYTPETVKTRYGIGPEQMVFYKAMVGDTSDNIKGVPGIGPKTAVELLSKYVDLEGILAHLDELPASTRKKIEDNRDLLMLSEKLARIIRDVPVEFDMAACSVERLRVDKLRQLFQELEFKRLLARLDTMTEKVEGRRKNGVEQTAMF